jgi:hypothetical protein
MSRHMRQLVIWALVAVIACGNGLGFSSAAYALARTGVADGVSRAAPHDHAKHHDHAQHDHAKPHDHAQHHGHDHSATADTAEVADLGDCENVDCVPDEPPARQCCHTNANCSMTFVTLPAADSDDGYVRRESVVLFDAGAALPLGALFYPLLRPPCAAA